MIPLSGPLLHNALQSVALSVNLRAKVAAPGHNRQLDLVHILLVILTQIDHFCLSIAKIDFLDPLVELAIQSALTYTAYLGEVLVCHCLQQGDVGHAEANSDICPLVHEVVVGFEVFLVDGAGEGTEFCLVAGDVGQTFQFCTKRTP